MNEAAFRDLISGERRGAIAGFARLGLKGLSYFYSAGVRVRNALFDIGLKRSHSAGVPVVSVGNITTGGTGKTPFVAWLANSFRDKGLRVVLLSRGYRALPGSVNDEKLVLDLLCPGIPHVQNPDRVAGAATAIREHGAQLIILDDGFQHRRLARDLDIVLVDALCPWGYGSLLPRGLLREPLAGLRRAHLVVLTRADQIDEPTKAKILTRIHQQRGSREVVEVAFAPVQLRNAAAVTTELAQLDGERVAAFCGIGNPSGFRRTLKDCRFDVTDDAFRAFPDHHHYNETDLQFIESMALKAHARAIVTTQKDLVKIQKSTLGSTPLWSVEIGTKILYGAAQLEKAIVDLLSNPLR